ncbi:MAG: MFS transporter [Gemmataceae bacterium]|nr:MFS transporter [Gemmataceae bacterium]
MNLSTAVAEQRPSGVRYGVLGFVCVLSMITYLDRVCFGTVSPYLVSEFGFSESDKGWIFFAFTIAYAAFEVPSGWLGDRFGARMTLIRIVLWWSAFTALTGSIYPTPGSTLALGLLLGVRFLFGMGEAGAYPNIARALHNWFPFAERGFAKGAVWMAGRFAGGITAFIVYALMYETATEQGVQVHWRHIFYIFGGIGVIWCVLWWWWYRDNPAAKAGVNAAEIALIRGAEHASHGKLVVPWGKLLTNANLWILCLMYACSAYGWYLNITYFPGYLKEQLHIEPGNVKWTAQFWIAGLMAGLPLLIGSVACLVGGFLTDSFIKRTGNRKWGRRLFGVIGHGLCACCFFAAIFFMKSPWAFVLLIAFAAFWNDLTMGASWASCLDIGRRYSGIVAGCMNTIGNLGGGLANIFTGWILDWHTGPLSPGSDAYIAAKDRGWTVNIFIFGAAYVIAVLCWLKFDSTKPVVPDK